MNIENAQYQFITITIIVNLSAAGVYNHITIILLLLLGSGMLFYRARCIVWRCPIEFWYDTASECWLQFSGRVTFVFVFSKSKSFPSNLYLDFSLWEWDYGLVCGTAGQQTAHLLTKFQLFSNWSSAFALASECTCYKSFSWSFSYFFISKHRRSETDM